ncbi:hypothetical protein BC830DRAFT_1170117 [Chytriomyces sp. MP71]|nr:hypothetical protein BC830DRAFT_1170117 [Chytriomyces sp. MP71]
MGNDAPASSLKGPPPKPPTKPKALSSTTVRVTAGGGVGMMPGEPQAEGSTHEFSAQDAAVLAASTGGIQARIAALGLSSGPSGGGSSGSSSGGMLSVVAGNSGRRLSSPHNSNGSSGSALGTRSFSLSTGSPLALRSHVLPDSPASASVSTPHLASTIPTQASSAAPRQRNPPPPPPPSRRPKDLVLPPALSPDEVPPRPTLSPEQISYHNNHDYSHADATAALSSPPPPVRLRNSNNRRSASLVQPASSESLAVPGMSRAVPGAQHASAEGASHYQMTVNDSASVAGSVFSASTDATGLGSSTTKREKVVREILETERSYFEDMVVLNEVYVIPATEQAIFPTADIKVLFGNVDSLIEVSREVLRVLGEVVPEDRVGDGFLALSPSIEETYTDYCKNNEAAMTKLFDYSSPETSEAVKAFWKECQEKLRGRTNAWDLSSLIIKPVQRVLKYPLLLGSLLKETPETAGHPDHPALLKAFNEMSRIAETINEVKKRKDTVEKYVEGKGSINVMHGISKKFARTNEKLKHATKAVADLTKDEEFDGIYDVFICQHAKILAFSREVNVWIKTLRDVLETQEILATGLEEVYMVGGGASSKSSLERTSTTDGSSGTVGGGGFSLGSRSISAWPSLKKKPTDLGSRTSVVGNSLAGHVLDVAEYRRLCAKLAYEPWKDAENDIKASILPAINTLLHRLKEPLLLLKKREDKLLDHDRAKRMKAKGEAVDKALEASSDAYVSINAELILELPKLCQLIAQYMDAVFCHFVTVQARSHERVARDLAALLQNIEVAPGGAVGVGTSVIETYRNAVLQDRELMARVWDVGILERWREEVWRSDALIVEDDAASSVLGRTLSGIGKAVSSRGGSVSNRKPESIRSVRTRTESVRTTDADVGGRITPLHPFSSQSIYLSGNGGGFDVVALYAFVPETSDELEFAAGDIIFVETVCGRNGDMANEDWWYGSLGDGREGWIPANYVSRSR